MLVIHWSKHYVIIIVVDRNTAMEEVGYGNYYAVIIVPENFSETLVIVVTEDLQNLKLNINEKINAIAPKITDKGASVIVDQISSQFIATVNGVIFDMFNQIGLELEADLPSVVSSLNLLF